jgi:dTDP-4-amino-4,6-dideoxygalactose transaminase
MHPAAERRAKRRNPMRIEYAGSVHDEEEIAAVVSVLRGGPSALRIGKHVREFERLVAASFGKQRGVMCNSGSSALYLAIELLGLSEGDEIVTSPLTFSTDIAPMKSRLVPVFVDGRPRRTRSTSEDQRNPRRGRRRSSRRTSRATVRTGTRSAGSRIVTACE